MCSNRSSGSYKELQDDNSVSASCPKKQKKDNKVRRRGPGVAELEKLRLEQELKSPIRHSSSSSSIDYTLFALPPPPETSLYTTFPIFRPPVFPLANGSFSKQYSSSLHHQMMNQPNPSPGQGRFYQFIEPPSNQIDTNVSQYLEEEQKMINARKPWQFLTETSKKASAGTISRDEISIGSFPRHYTKFTPLSLEYEGGEFDENTQWRSKKPFYSFISSDDRSNGHQEQGPFDRYGSDADNEIDLDLKL